MNINDLDWTGSSDCLLKLYQFWGLLKKVYACAEFVRMCLCGEL